MVLLLEKILVHPESSIDVPFIDANNFGGVQSKAKAN
jgi:hypothetical protein